MSQLNTSRLQVVFGNRTVLNDLDLSFERGQITAIVGPNGAGKSTLLDCLAGLRQPQSGSVAFDGQLLNDIKPRERAKRISYLPQYSELAWEVDGETLVGLGRTPHTGPWGLTDADRIAVQKAMARTKTEDFSDRTVSSLSGGERGRLLLARALATSPSWLVADEPLAGLDPGHALDVLDLFKDLAAHDGLGIIVTLHDLTMALRIADRVIVLCEGRVLADGTPRQALTPQVLNTAYGINAELVQGRNGDVLEILSRA